LLKADCCEYVECLCRLEDSETENRQLTGELEYFRSQNTTPRDKYARNVCWCKGFHVNLSEDLITTWSTVAIS